MRTVGIIAEYNPFHKGHSYHLSQARSLAGADYCMVAMSGNFLQRGEAACLDKYARAECALSCGADLVLELPVPFATSSAPAFARNGVELLQQTGVLTHLAFGSECEELHKLEFLADFFNQEPEPYQKILKENLRRGLSYPTARKTSFLSYFSEYAAGSQKLSLCPCSPEELAELLDSPNNILALSYLRSLKTLAPNVQPLSIKRKGAGYHQTELTEEYPSATAIRREISLHGLTEKALSALPEASASILSEIWAQRQYVITDDYSQLLYYKLLSLPDNSYSSYIEVSDELGQRIKNHLSEFTTFTEFARLLMRKNETHTTILRGLMHILLDIKKEAFQAPAYLRILGFKKEASPLLHEIKEKSQLPLITKAADASFSLQPSAYTLFEKELYAENVYHSIFRRQQKKQYHPYRETPVIL